jgi:hypothetical protein
VVIQPLALCTRDYKKKIKMTKGKGIQAENVSKRQTRRMTKGKETQQDEGF